MENMVHSAVLWFSLPQKEKSATYRVQCIKKRGKPTPLKPVSKSPLIPVCGTGETRTPVPATCKSQNGRGTGREEKWCFAWLCPGRACAVLSKTADPKPLPEKSNRWNWAKVHVPDQLAARHISKASTLAISPKEGPMPHIE